MLEFFHIGFPIRIRLSQLYATAPIEEKLIKNLTASLLFVHVAIALNRHDFDSHFVVRI